MDNTPLIETLPQVLYLTTSYMTIAPQSTTGISPDAKPLPPAVARNMVTSCTFHSTEYLPIIVRRSPLSFLSSFSLNTTTATEGQRLLCCYVVGRALFWLDAACALGRGLRRRLAVGSAGKNSGDSWTVLKSEICLFSWWQEKRFFQGSEIKFSLDKTL